MSANALTVFVFVIVGKRPRRCCCCKVGNAHAQCCAKRKGEGVMSLSQGG